LTIEGVGKAKLEKYGSEFIEAIIAFQKSKPARAKKVGETYQETLALFNSKMSVEAIADKRILGVSTVISHIAKLYSEGHITDVSAFVTPSEIDQLKLAQKELEYTTALKPYFDYFEEKMEYSKIRMGLAVIERAERN
jgi:ATP-dependent DNA helicase RecQ